MNKRIISILLAVCLCVTVLAGCGGKSDSAATGYPVGTEDVLTEGSVPTINLTTGPATILPRLEKAYNSRDLYAIVECFDPSISEAFFGVVKLFGVEADAFADILPFFSKILGSSGALENDSWGTVTLTALEQTIDDTIGTLTYNVNIDLPNGTNQNFDETIEVMEVDGVWYISSTQPLNLAGLISGTTVVPDPIPVVEGITEADVEGELLPIEQRYLYGIMNASGKTIINPFFAEIGEFTDGYCPVLYKKDNFKKWGIIDKLGNLVVDYTFDAISESSTNGYWAVCSQGKWGFLNIETGNTIDIQYDAITMSNEGFWAVCLNGKWGYLNPTTEESIPCEYDDYGQFRSDVTLMKLNGYWGAVNRKGDTVINFIYNDMTEFKNDMAIVKVNNGYGVIRTDGSYVLELTKAQSARILGNYIIMGSGYISGDTYSVYNLDGELIYNCAGIYGVYNGTLYTMKYKDSYTNIIVIDNHGNTVTDYYQDIVSSLPFELRSLSPEMGEQKYAGEYRWLYVRIDGLSTTNDYAVNFINSNGEFILPQWIRMWGMYPECSDDYLLFSEWVSNKPTTLITYVYDWNGNQVAKFDGCYDLKENRVLYNYENNTGNGKFYSLVTREYLDYETVTENEDNTALIVYDGFFYGLYYDGSLLGDGVVYNKIEYDEGMEIFTLEHGAETQYIRIGRDGTINSIES